MELIKFGLDSRVHGSYERTYQDFINKNIPACQLSIGNTVNLYDLVKSKKLLNSNPNFYTCFHGNITLNLAGSTDGSSDPQYGRKLTNCKNKLLRELDIATFLEKGVIVHVGTQKDEKVGLRTVVNTINEVLMLENCDTVSYSRHSGINIKEFRDKRRIILENSAKKGNQLGDKLEHISIILSQINPSLRDNVSVCIDTCHLHDAGQYDLGKTEEVHKFYKDFTENIGINKLECFHLNDAMYEFGSRADVHAHLTQGHIFGKENGELGLKEFVKKTSEYSIPMIGEFSDGKGEQDIDVIKRLF